MASGERFHVLRGSQNGRDRVRHAQLTGARGDLLKRSKLALLCALLLMLASGRSDLPSVEAEPSRHAGSVRAPEAVAVPEFGRETILSILRVLNPRLGDQRAPADRASAVLDSSEKYGIDPALLMAVMWRGERHSPVGPQPEGGDWADAGDAAYVRAVRDGGQPDHDREQRRARLPDPRGQYPPARSRGRNLQLFLGLRDSRSLLSPSGSGEARFGTTPGGVLTAGIQLVRELPTPVDRTRIRRTEAQLPGARGEILFRREWRGPAPERSLLLVHGLAEHSGRYEHFGAWFAERGCAVHAYDLIGHGQSDGARGHLRKFSDYLDDLDAMLHFVREHEPELPIVLVGHSVGGLVVTRSRASAGRRWPAW